MNQQTQSVCLAQQIQINNLLNVHINNSNLSHPQQTINNQIQQQQTKQLTQYINHRRSMKTQQTYNQKIYTNQIQQTNINQNNEHNNQTNNENYQTTKHHNQKLYSTTYRPYLIKSIHQSNQLILVYLMYKQQKLSLFLNKGISFEYLIKKLYKEIYIYQKQTYSISNAIIKNLLHKITGFQSIDNDLIYDYQLKYKRGTLNKQKFFIPFKQESHKLPFKIYTNIQPNNYGGNQFLARNYSDGQWIIFTTIKKSIFDEQKINSIKKSLKNNFMAGSLLLKNCSSSFSQINWIQTKHYIMVISQYFPQTLQQNLIKNTANYSEKQCQQIFIYYAKWFAYVFKQMIISNVQNFKKLSLKNIGLNPSDGLPKISIFDNVIHCIDFAQRRRSVLQNGKRVSQKINDNYYYGSYVALIKQLIKYLGQKLSNIKIYEQFMKFLQDRMGQNNFSFQIIFRYLSFEDANATWGVFQRQRQKHPLKIDYKSKFVKIIQNMQNIKNNTNLLNQQTILLSQMKQQIQKLFSMQNMRKNQQRNQTKSILQMLSSTSLFAQLKKQNIGNVTEYKKQQQRKYNIKTKQKLYIQEILNELNKNQNFIKTTKQNNLASIQFYLKKSDAKVKDKIIGKINTKYKKFFQRKQTHQDEEELDGNMTTLFGNPNTTVDQMKKYQDKSNKKDQQKQNICGQSQNKKSKTLNKSYILPGFNRNHQKGSNTTKVDSKNTSSLIKQVTLQKENFTTQIFNRLQQRNTVNKLISNSLKSSQPISPTLIKKKSKLQQLFVNNKDYSKQQKLALKKKQYGIYLQQAQKQYNKIRLYRKNTTQKPTK